jgi:hypothetical protein
MQVNSLATKLGGAVFSSSLAAVFIGLSGASASAAQITIRSTGSLSGTIELPSINPNFNQSTTRIDTDSTGTYFRNGVPIYTSDYVKSRENADGSESYFVDFKGIPFVSLDGILSSPVLSGGQLTSFNYQGNPGLPGVQFQGVIQDEFNLTRASYTGFVTDPSTGKLYQGTFQVSGFGPRYSASRGGETPTVFDFQSDIPGSPTIKSLLLNNAQLTRLTIRVDEADEVPVPEPMTIGGSLIAGVLGLMMKRKSAKLSKQQ